MTQRWIAFFLQFLIVLPASVSAYLVMRHQLRWTAGRTAALCAAVLVSAAVLGAALCTAFDLNSPGPVLLPSLIALFFLYRYSLRCSTAKCLAVFVGVCAMQTFPCHFARAYDALSHPDLHAASMTMQAAVLQFVLCSLVAACFVLPEIRWFWRMVDDMDIPQVWYATIVMSLLFLIANTLAVPRFYSTIRVARMGVLYPVLEAFGFIILAAIYGLFFYGTSVIQENADLKEQSRLLPILSRQYGSLLTQMEYTAQLRHDFRHSARLLSALADKGDLESLRAHLAQYAGSLDSSSETVYCTNPALNALFSYYGAAARDSDIRTDWKLDLPDPLPIGELDLASVFGNMIENAIDACRNVPREKRYFALTAEMRKGVLYIVSTNSFCGDLREGPRGFESTKHGGSAVGISSVEAIAAKYGGSARAYSKDGEFCMDVLLRGLGACDEPGAPS